MSGQRRQSGGEQHPNAPRQMQRSGGGGGGDRIDYEKQAGLVLAGLQSNRAILEPLLPAGSTWEQLHATIATLLVQKPGILKCTIPSIIRGCMKAVYDGVRLDGVQAALVPSENTYGKGQNAFTKLEARYNIMIAGMRSQIIRGGLVDDVTATVVYEGEPYRVLRGSNPSIEHEEILERRGPGKKIVAVYSMAWLKNGRFSFETMNDAQVLAVRELAMTKNVWDKNDHEMYRKTVVRRHRKSLPGCTEIRDAEMEILFPHMSRQNPEVAAIAPPRPDRRDYQPAQVTDQSNNIFTSFDTKTGEVFEERQDQQDGDQGGDDAASRAKPARATAKVAKDGAGGDRQDAGKPAATEEKKPDPPANKIALPDKEPADAAGWRAYADEVKRILPKLGNVDEINLARRAHETLIGNAPGAIGDELDEAFTEALTDLVGGGA